MNKSQTRNDNILTWLQRNWAVLAFAGSIAYQVWTASVIAPIKEQNFDARLTAIESTYVTQKDLTGVMNLIDYRLADLQANVAKLSK